MTKKKLSFRFKEISRSQETGKFCRDILKKRYYRRLGFYYCRSDSQSSKDYFTTPF